MAFDAGTRLGPYEIIARLGAGGMGEVYRARDTRLDRIVAVKVLTDALASDSEARQRFEHEARAIAALSDPHICTIYDVGRHGDFDYLVLEYLEGETLADRLRRSPALTIDEALAIAIPIGDGLDHAHRAGIVHRDLKPGNVMLVRRTGASAGAGASGKPDVKLLDFGLAARTAATSTRPAGLDASLMRTISGSQVETRAATSAAQRGGSSGGSGGFSGGMSGGFSGTVQYMAPEQIDGETGDHRVDIFAFGCVLYEMLAGRKAFEGNNALAVIGAIVSGQQPPPIAALPSAHPVLDHLMRRCIEKDRERRWQNIGDVAGELRWIAEQPTIAAAVAATAASQGSSRRSGPGFGLVVMASALALMLGAIAGAVGSGALRGGGGNGSNSSSQAALAASVLPAVRYEITTTPTDDASMALSPDGTMLAFVANKDRVPMLWVRALDAIENRVLPGTEGARFPFWSPDGRTIGFFAQDKLKRIDVGGGTPLIVTDAPNARGGTWNAEGVILFAPGVNAPIVRVSSSGGPVQAVTQVNAGSGPAHRLPQFLPDNKHFVFSSTLGTPETNGVYVGSLDKTPPVRVLANDVRGRFAPPDKLLTVQQGALQAYTFDVASGGVRGEPSVVAQGFTGAAANAMFATSDNGVLAYREGAAQVRQLVWVNRQGATLRAIGEPSGDAIASPELSADEQSVLVVEQRTGDNDIWLIELARNLERRITNGQPADAHPLWSADGQSAIFHTQRFAGGAPARQSINGGPVEPLFPDAKSGNKADSDKGTALALTRDGQYLLMRRNGAQTGSDLIAVAMNGAKDAAKDGATTGVTATRDIIVAQSTAEETEGQFSPDGKWVAFVSNDSGRPEVFIQPFPDGRPRTQVSTTGGAQVRWSHDGREIFYIAPDGKMMSVSVALTAATADVKPPVALFQTHLATGTNVVGLKPQYAVARDGRFLLNTAIESASAPIIVSVNWMKKLAK